MEEGSSDLSKFLEEKEEFIRKIGQLASHLHAIRDSLVHNCECSFHSCQNDSEATACQSSDISGHGSNLSELLNDHTIFSTPPNTNLSNLDSKMMESICTYKHLSYIVDSLENSTFTGFIYLATTGGYFTRYPSHIKDQSSKMLDDLKEWESQDVRLSPWYLAASTDPKDIVIVVEKSGLANGSNANWDLASKAVQRILDTFTPSDFVNVVIFSDEVIALNSSNMVEGSKENMASMKDNIIKSQISEGEANFTAAFDKAFSFLKNCSQKSQSCSNCQKIILFLTYDEITSVDENRIKPSELISFIDDKQEELKNFTGKRASIFTYSVGEKADDSIPRQIACANQGVWASIEREAVILDALNSYYLYSAAGLVTSSPRWTIEPSTDSTDSGLKLATVSIPFYAKAGAWEPQVLLGVVANTFKIESLKMNKSELTEFVSKRSSECNQIQKSQCELQIYRKVGNNNSVCPDILRTAGSNSTVICQEFNQKFYRMFNELVNYASAKKRCKKDGGELVSVRNIDDLTFLSSIASPDGSWVENKALKKRDLECFNSDTNIPSKNRTSECWGHGQLSEGDCVAVDKRGIKNNLFTLDCRKERSYICEYSNSSSCPAPGSWIPEKHLVNPRLSNCLGVGEGLIAESSSHSFESNDIICNLGKIGSGEGNEEISSGRGVSFLFSNLFPILIFWCAEFL